MIEVRFHGRGGQGAVTSAELMALAAIDEGKYAQAFPSFGPERRGAPVVAFLRVSGDRIRVRSKVYDPDVVVVLDPTLLNIVDVAAGLKPEGILVINTSKSFDQLKKEHGFKGRLAVVDATKIALEEMKVPITNTTMVGALIRATGLIRLESIDQPLQHRFGKIAERNKKAMQRAFEETQIKE
ncbi:MAG: pyruvate ferredoxin oxidoreductase subunit gamma [Deltaproteobacteria bacterium]|nr:pyruvate ferredoxin oxidoreductase subunit gamma [Deltaproteobacteria bacterium]